MLSRKNKKKNTEQNRMKWANDIQKDEIDKQKLEKQ